MHFHNNILHTIIDYVKIRSHFVIKFQVANFQVLCIYLELPEYSYVGLNIEKILNFESNKNVTCDWRITSPQKKKLFVQLHSRNKKSLYTANFGSAVIMEKTHGFITKPRWGNVQEICVNVVGHRDTESSRLWPQTSKWWQSKTAAIWPAPLKDTDFSFRMPLQKRRECRNLGNILNSFPCKTPSL
jgi:hypothetical protein